MKYLITESQYSGAINAFLTIQLMPDEIKKIKYPDRTAEYWVKDNKIVAINDGGLLWVDSDLFNTFMRFFSIGDFEYDYKAQNIARKHIFNWIKKNKISNNVKSVYRASKTNSYVWDHIMQNWN